MRRFPAHQLSRPGLVITLVLLGLLLLPQGAPAHPPSDLQLAFDEPTRVLSVTITHPVADPATHYVKRVGITAGGATDSGRSYTSQPASSPFTYTYTLRPDVKGEIQVVAECSISGSIARSITVAEGTPVIPGTVTPPSPPGAPPGTRTTLPGAAPPTTEASPGLLPLAAALALAGWRFRR